MFNKVINKIFGKNNDTNSTSKVESYLFASEVLPIKKSFSTDVFIVGFPKSGNTLMQHIVAYLYYGINDRGSWSMVNLIAPDVYANTHYFRFNEVCFFKSHERPNKDYRRVIYLIRDGREALQSYHHMLINLGKKSNIKELFQGKEPIFGGEWHQHISAWETNPYNADILWVKYEDLITNKKNELIRICKFLNIERSDLELDIVVELSSLDHMKQLESRSDWTKAKEKIGFDTSKSFVRKGKTNSYEKNIDKELIDVFNLRNKDILNRYY